MIKRNQPNDIPERPQPERNTPPPQNQGANRGTSNFSFNVFGFPFFLGGFGFSFGNQNEHNRDNNSNINRPSDRLNIYIFLVMIALNLLGNFGPLIFEDYETETRTPRKTNTNWKKQQDFKSRSIVHDNSHMWGLLTMILFFGIAVLWKFLKRRR